MDDFDRALAGLRQALIDLDGDGKPDAEVLLPVEPQSLDAQGGGQQAPPSPAPVASSNAMAQGRSQPQGFETIRQEANNAMRPAVPAQPQQQQSQSLEEWANDPSFNDGRGRYGLVPSVVRGVSRAANAMRPVANPDGPLSGVNRYLERSAEAIGRAPRQIMEMSSEELTDRALGMGMFAAGMGPGSFAPAGTVAGNAMRNPEVTRGAVTGNWAPVREASKARETTIMNAPPHTLQTRNAKGQFEKLEGETREIRDRAIRDRARRKSDPMQYDAAGEPLGTKSSRDYLSKI